MPVAFHSSKRTLIWSRQSWHVEEARILTYCADVVSCTWARAHTHTHSRTQLYGHTLTRQSNHISVSLAHHHIYPYARLLVCYLLLYKRGERRERAREKKTLMLCCIQNKSSAVLAFISVWHVFISILTLATLRAPALSFSYTPIRYNVRESCVLLVDFISCLLLSVRI